MLDSELKIEYTEELQDAPPAEDEPVVEVFREGLAVKFDEGDEVKIEVSARRL